MGRTIKPISLLLLVLMAGCGGGGGSQSVLQSLPRSQMVGAWQGKFADEFANPSRHGSYFLVVNADYSFAGHNQDGGFRADATGRIETNGTIWDSQVVFPSGNMSLGKPGWGHLTLLASGHLQGALIFQSGDVTLDLTRSQ